MFVHRMARHDFDTDVGLILIEEVLEFRHVIEHESIFPELHLDENALFDKINLLKGSLNLIRVRLDFDGVGVSKLAIPA